MPNDREPGLPTPEQVRAHAERWPCMGGGVWRSCPPTSDLPRYQSMPRLEILRARGEIIEVLDDYHGWLEFRARKHLHSEDAAWTPCTPDGDPVGLVEQLDAALTQLELSEVSTREIAEQAARAIRERDEARAQLADVLEREECLRRNGEEWKAAAKHHQDEVAEREEELEDAAEAIAGLREDLAARDAEIEWLKNQREEDARTSWSEIERLNAAHRSAVAEADALRSLLSQRDAEIEREQTEHMATIEAYEGQAVIRGAFADRDRARTAAEKAVEEASRYRARALRWKAAAKALHRRESQMAQSAEGWRSDWATAVEQMEAQIADAQAQLVVEREESAQRAQNVRALREQLAEVSNRRDAQTRRATDAELAGFDWQRRAEAWEAKAEWLRSRLALRTLSANLAMAGLCAKFIPFLRGLDLDWDCDTGANSSHPSYCRCCEAEDLIASVVRTVATPSP